MPRPRSDNPSPAALRMRKMRAKSPGERIIEGAREAVAVAKGETEPARLHVGRLTRVVVWVPHADVKAMHLAAERFRRIARIPESEVPDQAGSPDP